MKKKTSNKLGVHFFCLIVFAGVSLQSPVSAWAQLTIHDVQATDVTSAGFSVIWRTSEAATSQIAIFSNMAGETDITSELEVRMIPLIGGDPQTLDDFGRDEGMDDLRNTAKTLGLMKIDVQGCDPRTPYYFKVFSDNGVESVQWPESGLVSVTTTKENAFVQDSKQILVTLTDNLGTIDFQGWLLTAATNDTIYPVSSYVGDGGKSNQAYLDLSNLFDGDEDNWTPTGLQVVTLEVRMPGDNPVQRGLTLIYSEAFHVSMVRTVEINLDEAGDDTPPVITPSIPGGTYVGGQDISLAVDEQAYIFFSTDGSNPTTASTFYTDPVPVDQTTTLKFMAVDMSGNQSGVEAELYNIVYNELPYEPFSPDPVDGTAGVSIETALRWQSAGDPDPGDVVTYDVSLWTDENNGPPICEGLIDLTCAPGVLQFNTTYFWQVVAKDNRSGEKAGAIWRFSTFSHDGDEDGDGLNNADEISWMTDPYDWDTDKDGYSDFDEIGVGSDPLDRTIRPPYPPGFGDVDGDQNIDGTDLALLLSAFDTVEGDDAYLGEADLDGDGAVNASDLELFSRVFGLGFVWIYDPAADFDGDGDVDGADFSALVDVFGLTQDDDGFDDMFDLNPDGVINHWDAAFFSMAFGTESE